MKQQSTTLLKKLALLVKLKSLTQKQVADECGVSRITIHRFLSGKSEIKATDFLNFLEVLDIEVEPLIESRINHMLREKNTFSTRESLQLGEKISHLDPLVQKTVLEQINWWSTQ